MNVPNGTPVPDQVGEPLAFMTSILNMNAYMRGELTTPFIPPTNHARELQSQFRMVINTGRAACLWLNQKTDALSDNDACMFVLSGLQDHLSKTIVDTRRTAFGSETPVYSSVRIVGVTCYPASEGSANFVMDREQLATRRFVVHFNGF